MAKPNVECLSAVVVPQEGSHHQPQQEGDDWYDLYDWQPLHIAAQVRNTGDGDAEAFRVRLQIDGHDREDARTHALPAGYDQWIEWWHDPIGAGDHTLTVVCDYKGTVHESDEGDNTFHLPFHVRTATQVVSFDDEAEVFEVQVAPARPQAEIVSVRRGSGADVLVQFDSFLEPSDAGRFLFTAGVPAGVDLEIDMGTAGLFTLSGLTRAAVAAMHPDVAALVKPLLVPRRPEASVVSVERIESGRTVLVILDRELSREDAIRYLFESGDADIEIEMDMGAENSWELRNLSSHALAAMHDDVAALVRAAPVAVDPVSGTDNVPAWLQLKKAAHGVADDRLEAMNQIIYQAVDLWSDAAESRIEGIKGPSQSGLGLGLFTILSEVVTVVFVEAKAVGAIAAETVKAFAQTFASGMKAAGDEAAADKLQDAKLQVQRAVDRLKKGAATSAKAAWDEGKKRIESDLDALFAAFPEYASLPVSGDLKTEKWLVDQIGIPDVDVLDPSEAIAEKLWIGLGPALDMAEFVALSHRDQMWRLHEDFDSDDERRAFLERIGVDVDHYMRKYGDFVLYGE